MNFLTGEFATPTFFLICGLLHLFHICRFTRFICTLFLLQYLFYEMHWYICARLDRVIGWSIAILSYNIWRACLIAHMSYKAVKRVFTVVVQIFLGAFCVVENPVLFEFVSRSSNTCNNPSLSITSAHGQVFPKVYFRQLLWYSD